MRCRASEQAREGGRPVSSFGDAEDVFSLARSDDLRERGIDSSVLAAGCLEVIVRGSRAKMSLDTA